MAKKKPSYEEALSRIEEIVDSLETGNVTLDESIRLYKEGMELSAFCKEKLDGYEKEVMMLKQKADGSIEEVVFDGKEEEE